MKACEGQAGPPLTFPNELCISVLRPEAVPHLGSVAWSVGMQHGKQARRVGAFEDHSRTVWRDAQHDGADDSICVSSPNPAPASDAFGVARWMSCAAKRPAMACVSGSNPPCACPECACPEEDGSVSEEVPGRGSCTSHVRQGP